jgi:hypothetical protein
MKTGEAREQSRLWLCNVTKITCKAAETLVFLGVRGGKSSLAILLSALLNRTGKAWLKRFIG